MIMSADDHSSSRRPSELPMTLTTNVDIFRDAYPPLLWIRKSVDCYDSFTGVASIEFVADKVTDVVKGDKRIDLTISDGDTVRMLYR